MKIDQDWEGTCLHRSVVPNGKTKDEKNQGKIRSQTGPGVLQLFWKKQNASPNSLAK